MKHGHSIPLVMSLDTGKIAAQCHAVFNDWFNTVDATAEETVDFDSKDWYQLFGLTPWQYVPDDSLDEEGPPELSTEVQEIEGANERELLRSVRDRVLPAQPLRNRSPEKREPILKREHEPDVKTLPTSPREPHPPVLPRSAPSPTQRWFNVEEASPLPAGS